MPDANDRRRSALERALTRATRFRIAGLVLPACADDSTGKAKGTMHHAIIPFLQCLTCGQELRLTLATEGNAGEISAGTLVCTAGHTWPVEGGVLAFTRADAPSDPWSRTYANYDRYRHDQDEMIATSRAAVAPLVAAVKQAAPELLVDVCTGAGGLLFNLLPGGRFPFTHNHVERESEGWRHALQAFRRGGGSGDIGYLGLEREFVKLMDSIGSRGYRIEATRQVIGEPERDQASGTFPYPNEPLWETLVLATK